MKKREKVFPTKTYPTSKKDFGNYGDEGLDLTPEWSRKETEAVESQEDEEITVAMLIDDGQILRSVRHEPLSETHSSSEHNNSRIALLEQELPELKNRLAVYNETYGSNTNLPPDLKMQLTRFHQGLKSLLAERENLMSGVRVDKEKR